MVHVVDLRVLAPGRPEAAQRERHREPVRQIIPAVPDHVRRVLAREVPQQRGRVPRGPLPEEPRHHGAVEGADGRQQVEPLHEARREDGQVAACTRGRRRYVGCARRPAMVDLMGRRGIGKAMQCFARGGEVREQSRFGRPLAFYHRFVRPIFGL